MPERPIVNIDEVPYEGGESGHWGGPYKILTPLLNKKPGALGMNVSVLRKGHVGCPFHWHLREDEIFYVLSGRGVLRYGDELYDIRAGDAISCPAGSGTAHQIANPYDEDLVYLGIGPNDPHEVCAYPDSGKVMVRGLKTVGFLEKTEYMAGEPAEPKILRMIAERRD
jgi:uncharacterized cupin superfamily protein